LLIKAIEKGDHQKIDRKLLTNNYGS